MSTSTPHRGTETADRQPAAATGPRGRAKTRDSEPFPVPVLEARPGGPAERFAGVLRGRHPAVVFFAAVLLGFLLVAAASIGVGWLVNHVLLPAWGIGQADESVNTWLARQRTPSLTDVSAVGSAVGGAPVLPILVGVLALAFAARGRWRIAGFLVFALAVESSLYRVTSLAIPRQRPSVVRLDHLPADASFPSGHTAASVAVYSGLALLITSRVTDGRARALAWTVAVLMTVFVAASRMYRGMHHPSDVIAGALVGMAALVVLVFACRASGAAAAARGEERA